MLTIITNHYVTMCEIMIVGTNHHEENAIIAYGVFLDKERKKKLNEQLSKLTEEIPFCVKYIKNSNNLTQKIT